MYKYKIQLYLFCHLGTCRLDHGWMLRKLHPLPEKVLSWSHSQSIKASEGQQSPGDQGLGVSGSPNAVCQDRARPTATAREEGKLGNASQGQARISVIKSHTNEIGGHKRKSAHGLGLGYGSMRCMARHRLGCSTIQHGPRMRAAEMQLPREGMGWEIGGWICLRLLPALPLTFLFTTVWTEIRHQYHISAQTAKLLGKGSALWPCH